MFKPGDDGPVVIVEKRAALCGRALVSKSRGRVRGWVMELII
jgi:hypothetical protein